MGRCAFNVFRPSQERAAVLKSIDRAQSLDSKLKALVMVSHRIARSLGSLLSLGLSVSLTGVCAAADSQGELPTSALATRNPATLLLADSGSAEQWHKKQRRAKRSRRQAEKVAAREAQYGQSPTEKVDPHFAAPPVERQFLDDE